MVERKSKQILVVDDEINMLELYYQHLTEDYRVITTNCPFDALKLIEFSQKSIDLIILDYQMPGMTGYEILQQLRNLKIEIPAILCSGSALPTPYPPSVVTALEKPFSFSELSKVVGRILSEPTIPGTNSPGASGHKALRALDTCLDSLTDILAEAGCNYPQALDEKSALIKFGSGELTGVFYLWKSVAHLRASLHEKLETEEKSSA